MKLIFFAMKGSLEMSHARKSFQLKWNPIKYNFVFFLMCLKIFRKIKKKNFESWHKRAKN